MLENSNGNVGLCSSEALAAALQEANETIRQLRNQVMALEANLHFIKTVIIPSRECEAAFGRFEVKERNEPIPLAG